jgi:flavin reductase (DIM6/NTAB) family NADH-FMN oxidoreductase RutF
MISSATPWPIALVSSRSEDGVDNVAPFSYFGAVENDPPMVIIGFCCKGHDNIRKDSLVNIMAQKEFAVNNISEWYIDAANHTCGMFPPEVDEVLVLVLVNRSVVSYDAHAFLTNKRSGLVRF